MLTRKLLACAAVSTLAGSQAHAGEATTPPPDNAAVYNSDGSVSIAIPPFIVPNSVRNRTRPEYDAPGIRVGSFALRPSLNTGAAFNSNVFSTEVNQKSDLSWEFAPVLRLVSDFSRHALDFLLQTRSLIYKQHSSENITDVTASANGRIDVLRSTTIASAASYRILHEARGAPDMPANAAKPTRFSISRAEASLYHVLNRLRIAAGGSFERYVFADTQLQASSPQTLPNRDRDRVWHRGAQRPFVHVAQARRGMEHGLRRDLPPALVLLDRAGVLAPSAPARRRVVPPPARRRNGRCIL